MMKRVTAGLLCGLMLLVMFGCGNGEQEPDADIRIVVDADGVEVSLPMEITSVVDVWPANNQVLTMLGVSDLLVGTTAAAQDIEWMVKLNPHIAGLPSLIDNDEINPEEMLKINPDVIIVNDRGVESARSTGIPTVNMSFSDYDGLKEMVQMTAEIFGGEPVIIAEKFNRYFDENLRKVKEGTAQIPEEQVKKIYYARNDTGSLLTTDGAETMASEWIESIGGINVASKTINGFNKEISMEQLLIEDPEIIVLMDKDNAEALRDELLSNPDWSSVSAVKNRKIYINPTGVFPWDRYSTEQAMQILWAAVTVYPEYFEHIDIREETKFFYSEFFQYDLTDAEVDDILNTKLNSGF